MPKVPSLYNHSARPVVSRQISSSSGSTTSGRRHVTYSTNQIGVPDAGISTSTSTSTSAPDDDGMIIDDPVNDCPINDTQPSTELQGQIPGIPGIRVVAKSRAKRYQNSVSTFFPNSFLDRV
jgi:hypothetical protein